MKNDLDICIDIIKDMLVKNKQVTFVSDNYIKFKNLISEFVYDNNLDESNEWESILNSMIFTSNQELTSYSANNILINLEKLKLLVLKRKQEEIIFDKQVHILISKVCKKKYFDGHYADAVESAFKEINSRCKKIYKAKTGDEMDGVDLMNKLFSLNNPVLTFEDNSTESGKNVQKGYMLIFAGSITAIRNTKTHENQVLNKENAYKRIMLASLLMDKIDDAEEYEKKRIII